MRTFVLVLDFFIAMIFSILLLIPYFFLWLFKQERLRTIYGYTIVSNWARHIMAVSGANVEIIGLENLPKENNICFIGNHQSYFDILLVLGFIPKLTGFVAKKSLKYVPIFCYWAKSCHSLFIDRKNAKAAIKTMNEGVEAIKQGFPLVIFPEGTRSKGNNMGTFKRGSVKLALRSNAIVVPLSIQNTYKLFEEKHRIKPADIKLKLHQPIDTSQLSREERKELPTKLEELIRNGLTEIQASK